MTTRQNPMAGRYFNDPSFAAAVSNLAGAFAPPSPEEYLIAEKVKGQRTTNSALTDLYGMAEGNPDMLGGIVAGGWLPTQGFEAMRGGLANERYATDVGASTALSTNAADNARALEVALFGDATDRRGQDITAATTLDKARIDGTYGLAGTKLGYGDTMPGLPPEIAAAIGAPAFGPQSGAALGAPAPLMNESEMMAAIIGQQDPATQRALLDPSTVNTVGPDGRPIITSEIDAIGQNAFVNPGSEAAPDAITFERGGVRVGGFIKNGQFVDAAGTPLTPEEAGSAAKVGSPVGTNAELGITNSIITEKSRINSITTESDMLVDDLTAMIQGQAGAVGLAGTLQNVGQNILQVGQELGSAFAGDENALITPEMLSGVVQDGQAYDPTFAQLRAGMLQLAYLNAQRDNPSGEVSRFALERQIEALGQGLLSNDQSVLAALAMTKQANARKRTAYGTEGAAPAAPAAIGGPQPGTVEDGYQFKGGDPADPANWEPVQ